MVANRLHFVRRNERTWHYRCPDERSPFRAGRLSNSAEGLSGVLGPTEGRRRELAALSLPEPRGRVLRAVSLRKPVGSADLARLGQVASDNSRRAEALEKLLERSPSRRLHLRDILKARAGEEADWQGNCVQGT